MVRDRTITQMLSTFVDPQLTRKAELLVNGWEGPITVKEVQKNLPDATLDDRSAVWKRLLYLSKVGRIKKVGYGIYQRHDGAKLGEVA